MAGPFRVKALYEYSSPHEDDLNFPVGQVITVTDEEDEEWYGGEYLDDDGAKKEGIFPRNFVEKFEPVPPPRPARTRTRKSEDVPAQREPEPEPEPERESTASEPPTPAASAPQEKPAPQPEPKAEKPQESEAKSPPTASMASAAPAKSSESAVPTPKPEARQPPAQESAPPKPKASGPPPVAEKPASSSFKDRIAAFNKPAAAPIAPFKPGGLSSGGGSGGGSGGFIKKPFVPPPPSRDAYVPLPRDQAPQKVYRREEDPEIREQEAANQEQAEKAGLLPSEEKAEDVRDEDGHKPTSLKERIALLQKQQMEQAQRHAEAASKKEKPKKPMKRRSDTVIGPEPGDEAAEDLAPLERQDTETTIGRASTEDMSAVGSPPPAPRRKSSKGPAVESPHDGNEADLSGAGDTTEGQDDMTDPEDRERPQGLSRVATGASSASRPTPAHPEEQPEEEGDEEETEEDDVDPEVRRKEELRARMAKMSGGMGFHGMFGAPMPPTASASKKKKAEKADKAAPEDEADRSADVQRSAPPVPTPMALPGMGGTQNTEEAENENDEDDDREHERPPPPAVPPRQAPEEDDDESDHDATPGPAATSDVRPPPPIPAGRPAPPPVPTESRPPPAPPTGAPGAPTSVTEGSESDDELSGEPRDRPTSASDVPRSPPMPPQPIQPPNLPARSPPMSPREARASEETLPKRNSRPPPPIPGSAPAPPPSASRPPPPPPPGGLSRQSTADKQTPAPAIPPPAGDDTEEENVEYEGDYDTDIASSVPHKDALKAHARDSSVDESLIQSPTAEAPSSPPPVPNTAAPRAVPPPVPASGPAGAEGKRRSTEVPRAAPPPPPAPKEPVQQTEDYDPYNYSAPSAGGYSNKTPKIEEEAYFAGATPSLPQSPTERRPPPPTPGARSAPRTSMDAQRTSTSNRRSVDINRQSLETGFIANDMDLAVQSGWWKQANQLPPVLQGRRDIFFEADESTTTNQGAKTVVTREIFVLYQDYSQSIITVRFDPYDQTDVELDQRHEPPPRTLRQDEMEEFYDRYGREIAEVATSKKDSVVGDGTPQGLVMELLRPLKGALLPVGSRSYGALVYSNMANASTQQHDVIRAGDIVSFRNSKFQGKHGAMHAKYSAEIGKPDHVAIVAEWDGSKKKLRAWEQGRENKKVKQESYKLDDLRSGEVKVWRVVPRTWVGWNIQP